MRVQCHYAIPGCRNGSDRACLLSSESSATHSFLHTRSSTAVFSGLGSRAGGRRAPLPDLPGISALRHAAAPRRGSNRSRELPPTLKTLCARNPQKFELKLFKLRIWLQPFPTGARRYRGEWSKDPVQMARPHPQFGLLQRTPPERSPEPLQTTAEKSCDGQNRFVRPAGHRHAAILRCRAPRVCLPSSLEATWCTAIRNLRGRGCPGADVRSRGMIVRGDGLRGVWWLDAPPSTVSRTLPRGLPA